MTPSPEPRTAETMLRVGLVPDHLRRLGVPETLMSDFEFTAAVFRDSQFDPAAERPELMGGYDRRGLLNVIAWLAEAAGAPLREALTPEAMAEALRKIGPEGRMAEVTKSARLICAALAATPAPEPFYDSDGIPIPDELFAGLEPAPAPLDGWVVAMTYLGFIARAAATPPTHKIVERLDTPGNRADGTARAAATEGEK